MMSEPQNVRPLTWDDLAAMPEDNIRREIINGELFVHHSSPTYHHQRLLWHIRRLVDEASEGVGEAACLPLDVRLSAYDSVQPDLLFFLRGNRGILAPDGRITGAPDMTMEIVEPETETMDRIRKHALYATRGVREYWIVDPRRWAIEQYRLADGRYEPVPPLANGSRTSLVVPGLVLKPEPLFTGLWPREGGRS